MEARAGKQVSLGNWVISLSRTVTGGRLVVCGLETITAPIRDLASDSEYFSKQLSIKGQALPSRGPQLLHCEWWGDTLGPVLSQALDSVSW